MLNIHNLSVSFGTYLFEEEVTLGWWRPSRSCWKNGAGKSTMLKI
jgi:ATPase subunit of ABC transporter with duplicated ATPase domains